ncbi:hypothetical protein SteCoe_2560 [Stentor coeruleus]|uniref:Uncharacterized protein n=1 Tax=Stentor coeruleus TaxID=5963 RepID=A0A1R2CZD1_9CILI|nr:hypothetical protein SteCoe_9101 [Stentor coeruleus]OMJ94355.1 hypothetical protein SteCoe_2560 [Stentor coeruleus]
MDISKSEQRSLISQKSVKCSKFSKRDEIPLCFLENTPKEALVLEHVKDLERQFRLSYRHDANRPLLLYPKNECGTEKFICTTMRTTQMAFLELYDWQQAAEFIANFLEYEELNPPDQFPECIPAPSNVLAWQYGDCFDFAIALCSILRGAGYDAYCVHGRAPKEITTRDQTRTKCPLEIKENEMPDTTELPEQKDDKEFEIPIKPPLISEFVKSQQEKEDQEREQKRLIEMTIDDDAPEIQTPDIMKDKRLHCWVLVMEGGRGITESFFIEPTTGKSFPLTRSLYENVEFVWNDQNFWIHLYPNLTVDAVDFELYSEKWEHVMLPPIDKKKDKKKNDKDEEGEEGGDDRKMNSEELGTDGYVRIIDHVLDLPPSWCPKLRIDREVFAKKCPMGEKTLFYEKCKVEYYAEYSQYDGLIMCLTYYHDYKRHIVKEIRWIYKGRQDNLVIRRRFPLEYKTVEDYAPGCTYHWKQIVEIDGKSKIVIYYPTRYNDGLIRREEIFEHKTREFFQDRDDYMIYRSWKIVNRKSNTRDLVLGDYVIVHMTQKYDRNPNLPAGGKIEKIVYDIAKKKHIVYYHYEPGSIKRNVVEYPRDVLNSLGKVSDGQETEKIDEVRQQKLQHFNEMEKACFTGIKNQESSLNQDEESYTNQEEGWAKFKKKNDVYGALQEGLITKSIYDKARENIKEVEKEKEEDKIAEITSIDYLTPVLKELGYESKQLNSSEAQDVENKVMSLLKERLLHRANIIKNSLEKEKKMLQEEMNRFSKKGDHATPDDRKRYEDLYQEMSFKIEILEQRVARHEEQALKKYAEMSLKLKNESILGALHTYHKKE